MTGVNRKPEVVTDMARKHLTVIEAPARIKAGEPIAVHLKIGSIDGVEAP